ncbi:MAG: hypothetical protein ACYDC3_07735 [Candidatus Binataceae bacterium]
MKARPSTARAPTGDQRELPVPSRRLQELKRLRFTSVGRAARIARALKALRGGTQLKAPAEDWKWAAEDPDLEEQG